MCTGPLTKTCLFKTAHLPMVGISSDHKFNTSSNVLLGTAFWPRIFCGNQVKRRTSLRYGWGITQDSFYTLWDRLLFCLFILFLLVFSLSFLGIWRALGEPASRVLPGRPGQGLLFSTSAGRPLEISEVSDTRTLSGGFFVRSGFVVRLLLISRGCWYWCHVVRHPEFWYGTRLDFDEYIFTLRGTDGNGSSLVASSLVASSAPEGLR